jgi:glycosyltransferase involved in cell wall biosynthesis
MKLSVWILNHYAVSPDMPGGTRHYELGRQLAMLGHDVTILASSFHHGQRRETRLHGSAPWQVEEINGVRFVWLRTFPYKGNDWRRALNMVTYMARSYWIGRKLPRVSRSVPKPDVIIGSSVHLLAVVSALLLARHLHSSFVMEVRDLWPQTLVDMGRLSEHSLTTHLLRRLERWLYRHAQRIIVLLPKAGNYITALDIEQEKVQWIPNGVDLANFASRRRNLSTDGRFAVMYVGAHGTANNLDSLLDAAYQVEQRNYSQIRFILVGDGPEKESLQQRCKEMALENVDFHEPVAKQNIPDLLAQADALAFVLKDIGVFRYGISSNKLFDYLASGKPVLFACHAVNNVVDEARSGLSVPPGDPTALADAIIELYLMSPEKRAEMGRNGRIYVERNHDYAVLAQRLASLLQECVDDSRELIGDQH